MVYVEDVEQIVQFVKKVTVTCDGFEPTVFVKGLKGKVAVEIKEFGVYADKRTQMLNSGTYTALKQNVGELQLLILASEAWMSRNLTMRPSKDPKRVEVLIISSLDVATREEQMVQFEIMRNNKDKIIDLKELKIPGIDSVKGMLLPAFQKGYQIVQPTLN